MHVRTVRRAEAKAGASSPHSMRFARFGGVRRGHSGGDGKAQRTCRPYGATGFLGCGCYKHVTPTELKSHCRVQAPLRMSTYHLPATGQKRWTTLPTVDEKMRPPAAETAPALRMVSVPEARAAMLVATMQTK